MRLLVFGKTGQVATELRALAAPDLTITALGRDQADLEDPAACAALIAGTKADAVINAAAYTAVDAAEEDEEPGPEELADPKRALLEYLGGLESILVEAARREF